MSTQTSIRIPDEIFAFLDEEATIRGTSRAAVIISYLDEARKLNNFPGIYFTGGTAGRRARLVGGPDVAEVIQRYKTSLAQMQAQRSGTQSHELIAEYAISEVAKMCGVSSQLVREALRYFNTYPREVNALIQRNRQSSYQAVKEDQPLTVEHANIDLTGE